MQKPDEKTNAKAKKEVITYYHDGKLCSDIYNRVIPIVKKKKKGKKEFTAWYSYPV